VIVVYVLCGFAAQNTHHQPQNYFSDRFEIH
jgi:hypothetical protein